MRGMTASRIARKQTGRAGNLYGPEVTQIKCGDGLGADALGDRDDDGIDQAETQGPILPADCVGASDVLVFAVFHGERTLRQITQKGLLRASAHLGADEIIDLRQNRPGQQPVIWPILVECPNGGVMAVAAIEQREDGTGIGHNHRDRPMPFNRSSAFSLRSRRPLAKAPTLFGARRGS